MADETNTDSTENIQENEQNDSIVEKDTNPQDESTLSEAVVENATNTENSSMPSESIVEKVPDQQDESITSDSVLEDVTNAYNPPTPNGSSVEATEFDNKHLASDSGDEKEYNCPVNKYSSKVVKITKLPNAITVEGVIHILKQHTNEDIYNGVKHSDVTLIQLRNKKNAVVAFKTVEHASQAQFLLYHALKYKVGNVVFEKGNKRQAEDDDDDEPAVPEKIKKTDSSMSTATDHRNKSKVLFMTNIPTTWNKADILNFISRNTIQYPAIVKNLLYIYTEKTLNITFNGNCHVLFENPHYCQHAALHLRKAERTFDGVQIRIEFEYPHSNFAIPWLGNKPDLRALKHRVFNNPHSTQTQPHLSRKQAYLVQNMQPKRMRAEYQNWNQEDKSGIFQRNPILINQNVNSQDTYGISHQFLESLDITPPLTNKIYVDNLALQYDDETKIRNLFSHAGTVTQVAIIGKSTEKLTLKVDFDHPIEAVQAISMYNQQEVYGKKLCVRMDKTHNAYKIFYPPGLKSFGPGLCPNGSVLKNVRNTIELQRAVNMLMDKIESLKHTVETYQRNLQHQKVNEQSKNQTPNQDANAASGVQNSLTTLASSLTSAQNNPLLALGALLNPQATQVLQLLQQTTGNTLNPALSQPQTSTVTPQPQETTTWNTNQPGNINYTQPGFNQNPPVTNIQATPGAQPVPNLQTGPYMQGGPQSQNEPLVQGAPNMQVSFAQGGPGSFAQGGPNTPAGLYMQGGPNATTGQYAQGGQNATSGQYAQGGPNVAPAQYGQGAPNVAAPQYGQGGPNVATGQYAQGGLNVTTGQFAHGELNVPAGQFAQSGPNVPAGQYAQSGPNMPTGQYVQSGPNMPTGQYAQNTPGAPQPPQIQGGPVKKHDPCTVQFTYLPPSVTLAALHSKMHEVGKVRSAEITGPGRAVVSFYSPRDAHACIKLLDHTKVDGQTIDVRYL